MSCRLVGKITIGLFVGALSLVSALAHEKVSVELVPFRDLVDDGELHVQWSWKALGQDPAGRVYVVFGGPTADDASADCVLLRFDPSTGERRNLGRLSEALKTADNWQPGERIEKGHSALPYVDGKILIGTQGFHDAAGGPDSPKLRAALRTRGAHLIGYDLAEDRLLDLSASQPGGVFYQGRGFLELASVPGTDLVAAFTVPHGDLLLYDVAAQQVKARVPSVAERFGDRLGRILVAAPNGRIFYAYHVNSSTTENGRMYFVDYEPGQRCETPTSIPPGVWNGVARSRAGERNFISSQDGSLYLLDYEGAKLTPLGNLLPEEFRREHQNDDYFYQAPQVHGMALTADESKVVCIPFRRRVALADLPAPGERISGGTREAVGVFVFDLATGTSRRVAVLPENLAGGYFTGNDTRDRAGAIYFARHDVPNWGLVRIAFEE